MTKTEAVRKAQEIFAAHGLVARTGYAGNDSADYANQSWLHGGDLSYGDQTGWNCMVEITLSWGRSYPKNAAGDTVHTPRLEMRAANSRIPPNQIGVFLSTMNGAGAALAEINGALTAGSVITPKAQVDAWMAEEAEAQRIKVEAEAARVLAEKAAKKAAANAKRKATREFNKRAEAILREQAAAHQRRQDEAAAQAALNAAGLAVNVEVANGN